MKIRLFFLLAACFQMYNIYGQNPICLPNTIYKDSAAGIYPRPYNDSTKIGGITKAACIDQEYEFPLTVVIPSLITVPFGGIDVTVGLESAYLDTTKAVIGLPKGLRYFCNPGNCVMEKNKLGCITIKGKVAPENIPGIYNLVINLKLVTVIGTLDVAFPGPYFPGKYFLIVPPKDSSVCATSDLRVNNPYDGVLKAYPVPSDQKLTLTIDAERVGEPILRLCDITGRVVLTQKLSIIPGQNHIQIPVAHLANGSYTYIITEGTKSSTRRIIVWHD